MYLVFIGIVVENQMREEQYGNEESKRNGSEISFDVIFVWRIFNLVDDSIDGVKQYSFLSINCKKIKCAIYIYT